MNSGWGWGTWITALVFVLYCAELTVMTKHRLGGKNPVTYYALFWAAVVLAPGLLNLRLIPPSARALTIIAVAVTSLVVGALGATNGRRVVESAQPAVGAGPVLTGTVVISAVIAFCLGAYKFRENVAQAAGAPFGELSPQMVRYAQSYLLTGVGLSGLLFSLGGVCGALLVWVSEVYSRWWALTLVPLAWVVNLSPARTSTLGAATTTAIFYAYLRSSNPQRRRISRRHIVLAGFAGLAAASLYFIAVGNTLGKGASELDLGGPAWLPNSLKQIVLYFSGGTSALSAAIAGGVNPSADSPGRSISLILRLAAAVDPALSKPSTIAPPIDIPVWFNLYTGPGDAWFETGWFGLVLMFVFLGALASLLHSRARAGRPVAMFLSAFLTASLIASPLNINVFTVTSAFVMLVGSAAFLAVSQAPRTVARTVSRRVGIADKPVGASTARRRR